MEFILPLRNIKYVKDPSHNQSLLMIQLFLKHFTILPMFLNNEWFFCPCRLQILD